MSSEIDAELVAERIRSVLNDHGKNNQNTEKLFIETNELAIELFEYMLAIAHTFLRAAYVLSGGGYKKEHCEKLVETIRDALDIPPGGYGDD